MARAHIDNSKGVSISTGFTLIEIVIVLAIASIISTIVFFGVSGAQQSQRDEERRAYARDAYAHILSFAGNNGGRLDTLTASELKTYVGTDRKVVNLDIPATTSGNASASKVGIYVHNGTAPTNGSDCSAMFNGREGAVFQVGQGLTPPYKRYVATCLETKTWYIVEAGEGGAPAPSASAPPAPSAPAPSNPAAK